MLSTTKNTYAQPVGVNIKLYINTVKLEMFADINVCEFVILKVFALLKFAILGLIPRSHYRAITTIALIVSDRDIQAKTKI